MIKVGVFYPQKDGSRFDMKYYLEKHIPMVRQKIGPALKGVAVEQGVMNKLQAHRCACFGSLRQLNLVRCP